VHPAVDLSGLDGLERRVLEELLRIPKGEVRPYGWIARQAGRPRAARAVGTTCAHNPVPFLVPCHRVVPASGGLGNYAFGTERKRELLELEGVPVHELERLAESGARYVASRTTGIFCFPTCPDARRIREPNRLLLASESAARAAGLRSCRRCRPAAAA
jgi:O-6-methylguanine DNA methyltransferase